MSEDSTIQRQLLLLRCLLARRYGMSIQDMMDELGCGDKTVRRYIATLQEAGVPLEEMTQERGRKIWKLRSEYNIPLGLNYEQAFALYLGRKFLEPLAGTPFWTASREAFKLIRASLDKHAVGYLDQMADAFHATARGAGDYSSKDDIVDELLRGIEETKAVHIAYQSQAMTEPATRDVYPYGIAYHNGSLYLVAFSPEHRQIRHYKVDRISEAEVSEFRFESPDNFRMDKHFESIFGVFHGDGEVRVTVRFDPSVATYVTEKNWHASQDLERQSDGSILLTVHLSTTEEIKHWILGFGAKAVVIEPDSLVAEIRAEIDAMRDAYETASKNFF